MRWPWIKESKPSWPPLPSSGFVRERAATVTDIEAGDAVFCQPSDDGDEAAPYPVEVPQCALWRNENGGLVPSILVQAEVHIHEPESEPLFGLRRLDGSEVVALAGEVKLLGALPPP